MLILKRDLDSTDMILKDSLCDSLQLIDSNSPNLISILSPISHSNIDEISISPLLNNIVFLDSPVKDSPKFGFVVPQGSVPQSLTVDLEQMARSIIDFYSDGCSYSYKSREMNEALRPLSDRCFAILFCHASILLSLNNDDRFDQFLGESKKLLIDLKIKISSMKYAEDDLINLIVCLACHSFIASATGNIVFWKESFENLFDILKTSDVQNLINNLKGKDNKMVLGWVVNWFFYQDIMKVIKLTNMNKIGPLFSRLYYQKVLLQSSGEDHIEEDMSADLTIKPNMLPITDFSNNFKVDPILSCCSELYFVLGEINNIFDLFLIKITEPIDYYYSYIKPVLNELESEDEKILFLNSETYNKYESIRLSFHDWVQVNTCKLEEKIINCNMKTKIINSLPDDELENIVKYFTLFQRAILLYLKIKLKEISAPTYEIKQILLHMFKAARELTGTYINDYLLFPLLVMGASVCEYRDKLMIKSIYLKMNEHTHFKRNLNEVWKIILQFWDVNPDGLTYYMWQNVINRLDWNVCMI